MCRALSLGEGSYRPFLALHLHVLLEDMRGKSSPQASCGGQVSSWGMCMLCSPRHGAGMGRWLGSFPSLCVRQVGGTASQQHKVQK